MPDELTLTIVGIDFPNDDKSKSNRRMELLFTPPGESVDLLREHRNKHDSNAISVWSRRGVQVGYINAERAPWIGGRVRGGEEYEVIFQAVVGDFAYVRIRFGGGAPTLPPLPQIAPRQFRARSARLSMKTDLDIFYPDDDPPVWGA